MPVPDFKNIAAQLRKPDGEEGVKTAAYMGLNNRNMIRRTIDLLDISAGNLVLEIGYGGGQHLPYLLDKAADVRYKGIDISATMQQMATENNKDTAGQYTFLQADPRDGFLELPFPDHSFDRIFSVNTIYFWDNAEAQASEICRVLKPGGCFIVSFASRDFMKDLPFTAYGFTLYDLDRAGDLLTQSGFSVKDYLAETEDVPGMEDNGLRREFIMLRAGKEQPA